MSTIALLNEINQLCALDGIEIIKITADDKKTFVQSHDTDKTLFIEATLTPTTDFVGEFGLADLKMLGSYLKFYGRDEVKLRIGKREDAGETIMDEIEFRAKGGKSIYKLMNKRNIGKQAGISGIGWTVVIDDLSKDRIKNFSSFAQMFANIDGFFDITTHDGKLVFAFGKESSSTHSGTLEFADVVGDITTTLSFPVATFTTMMKLAATNEKGKLMFSDKGLLGVEIETEFGLYRFYLRQIVR